MKLFRQIIFWAHLIVAIPAAIVVLIMSVTGVALTYEKQMTASAIKRSYQFTPGERALSVEELAAAARKLEGRMPSNVVVYSDAARPAEARFGRQRTLFLDPYSGKVLGDGSTGTRGFMRTMTDWHRWLGQNGDGRETGKAITGACNLAFLFLVVSGIYLWWPRNWSRKAVRNVSWFRRGLSGKARDFNWHNTIGLWLFLPLLIIVASGVVISYPWASSLVYRAVGENPPPPRRQEGGGGGGRGERAADPSLVGIDALMADVKGQSSGWQSIAVTLPNAEDAPVSFAIDRGTGGQPQLRETIAYNLATGEVEKREDFASGTTGRKLRSVLRFAHTGEILGIPGQTLAGIASLGAAVLVWTGLALAIRRFLSWLGRRRRLQAQAESVSEAA